MGDRKKPKFKREKCYRMEQNRFQRIEKHIGRSHPFDKISRYLRRGIFQQNHDNFHQKCDGVNKTLVIGKLENSNQIVGGYNPLDWNGEGYKCTAKSFIFNISDRNDIKTANFSYVISKKSGNAINCHPLYL